MLATCWWCTIMIITIIIIIIAIITLKLLIACAHKYNCSCPSPHITPSHSAAACALSSCVCERGWYMPVNVFFFISKRISALAGLRRTDYVVMCGRCTNMSKMDEWHSMPSSALSVVFPHFSDDYSTCMGRSCFLQRSAFIYAAHRRLCHVYRKRHRTQKCQSQTEERSLLLRSVSMQWRQPRANCAHSCPLPCTIHPEKASKNHTARWPIEIGLPPASTIFFMYLHVLNGCAYAGQIGQSEWRYVLGCRSCCRPLCFYPEIVAPKRFLMALLLLRQRACVWIWMCMCQPLNELLWAKLVRVCGWRTDERAWAKHTAYWRLVGADVGENVLYLMQLHARTYRTWRMAVATSEWQAGRPAGDCCEWHSECVCVSVHSS